MTTKSIHTEIKRDIIRAFAVIDEWFDREPALLAFKPPNGNHSVIELLERVVHANGYLLDHDHSLPHLEYSVEKGMADHLLSLLLFDDLGSSVSVGERFDPGSGKDHHRIRHEFRNQLDHCICALELLHPGTSDVEAADSERTEFYQRISFISLYMKCQIRNLSNMAGEFNGQACEN